MKYEFDQHKEFSAVVRKAAKGRPDDAQLALINEQFALAELTEDRVYVRTFYLAHSGIDRDGDVFDQGLLQDFAKTLPGKGLFIKHPMSFDGDTAPGEGVWFEARVVDMSLADARAALGQPDLKFAPGAERAYLLEASAYMVRTASNEDLLAKIDAGIAKYVSIGFRASDSDPIFDANDNEIARRLLGPGEAYEGSLVWLGAQPGAAAFKALGRDTETTTEGNDVDTKELKDKLDKAEKRVDELKPKAESHEAMVKAIGGELAEQPQRVQALIDDAKSARESVLDDLVHCERVSGLIGDSEKEQKEAREIHEGKSLARLRKELDLAKAKAPAGTESELGGDDPNGDKGAAETGEQAKGGTREEEGFGNKAIA